MPITIQDLLGEDRGMRDPIAVGPRFDLNEELSKGAELGPWPVMREDEPGLFARGLYEAAGSVESALGIVSGAAAFPISGIAGAFGGLMGFDPQRTMEQMQELLTHEPMLPIDPIREASERQLESVGKLFELPRMGADVVGNFVMEGSLKLGMNAETASILGASVATFIEAGIFLLGPKAVKRAPAISRSSALALRKRLNVARKTGNWSDPKLAGSIQEVLNQAKKDPAMMANIERYADQFRRQAETGRLPDAGPFRRARERIRAERPPTAQQKLAARRKEGLPTPFVAEEPRVSRPVLTSNEIVAERLRRRELGLPEEVEGARIGGELARDLRAGFESVEDARAFGEIATLEEVKELRKLRRETLKAAKDFPTRVDEPGGELRSAGGQLLRDQADLYMVAIRAATGKPAPGGGPPPIPAPRPTAPTVKLRKGERIGEELGPGRVVAFRTKDGTIIEGVPFDIHPELYQRLLDEGKIKGLEDLSEGGYVEGGKFTSMYKVEKGKTPALDTVEEYNRRVAEQAAEFKAEREGVPAEPANPFVTQAETHGIEYNGTTGELVEVTRQVKTKTGKKKTVKKKVLVHEYFDPDTGERFTVDSAESVGDQLLQHRKNVADRTIKYEGVTLEGFARLIDEELRTNPIKVYKTAEHLQEFIAGKPRRTFEFTADIELFKERGEQLLSIINRALVNKGMEPIRAKGVKPPKPDAIVPEEVPIELRETAEKGILREDEVEVSIEEGVDVSEKLKTQAERDAYQAYLDSNEEVLATSEPRGFADIAHDAMEIIPTMDPNKVGAGLGGIRGLTHAQREAFMRLKSDAKRLVGNIEDVFKKLGFTDEQVAIAMKYMNELRDVEPKEGVKPQNYKVPAGIDIATDPIVKARKGKGGTTHIPLHKSFVDAVQFAKELSRAPLSRAFENPIRTFEAAGVRIKELLYDTWREGHHSGIVAIKAAEADISQLFKGVSLKSRKRIGAYGTSLQERGPNILAAQGIEVPRLTEFETGIYNALRSRYEVLADAINEMRSQIGKEPIEVRVDYMPYIRTFNLSQKLGLKQNPVWDKSTTLNDTYRKHIAYPFRFGIERVKKGAIPIELDAKRMFNTYNRTALKHLHESRAVALAHELVETKLPRFKNGQLVTNDQGRVVQDWMLKDHKPNLYHSLSAWTRFIAGQEPSRLPPLAQRALRILNRNLAVSILGANFRSFMIQPSALRGTYTEIGGVRTIEGIVASLQDATGTSKNRQFALKNSQVLEGRAYDVAAENFTEAVISGEVGAVVGAVGKASLFPLKLFDMETAIMTWTGAHRFATKNLKLKGKKAFSYADDIVTKTQASAASGDLAPIQRSVEGRTLTLFQTFVINDFGFLTKDVFGIKNPRMDNVTRVTKLTRYIAASAALSYVLEEFLGLQSPSATPIRDIQESIEEGDTNWQMAQKLAWGLTDPIPILASARYEKSIGGAGLETVGEFFASLRGAPLAPPIWEPGGKILGLPGITQRSKMLRAEKRGEGIYGQIAGTYRRKRRSHGLRELGELGELRELE